MTPDEIREMSEMYSRRSRLLREAGERASVRLAYDAASAREMVKTIRRAKLAAPALAKRLALLDATWEPHDWRDLV